jgi:uncharacterized repeat protein (TIGR02543 family)
MKRALAILLCLLMLGTLFPAAAAAEEAQEHRCSGLVFDRPLSGLITGTLEAGNYYLTGECVLQGHVKIDSEVNLCLNGFPVSVQSSNTFLVVDGGVFSIYDCDGGGLIGHYHTTLHNHPLTVREGGVANVYGGWLYGKDGSNAINNKGTVSIYGGRIESGMNYHCAVLNEGVVNLYGGDLIGYFGISQRYGAVLNIRGADFRIDSVAKALQYISDDAPMYIDVPAYRWRAERDGGFTASTDAPFVSSERYNYVEFAPLRYAIRYDLDGGTLDGEAPQDYLFGEGCALPEAVTKEGWIFTGWLLPDGDEPIWEISPTQSGDLTLLAGFEEAPAPTPAETAAPEEDEELDESAEPEPDPNDGAPVSALFLSILGGALAMLLLGLVIVIRHWKRKR